jgi:hypothetical protein
MTPESLQGPATFRKQVTAAPKGPLLMSSRAEFARTKLALISTSGRSFANSLSSGTFSSWDEFLKNICYFIGICFPLVSIAITLKHDFPLTSETLWVSSSPSANKSRFKNKKNQVQYVLPSSISHGRSIFVSK